MSDPEIRELLRVNFCYAYDDMLDELTIGNTIGDQTRADLVGITPQFLHGYEIKGDGDTLKRVPLQLRCYSSTFSRVSFVVTEKHVAKLLPMLPEYVGVLVAKDTGLKTLRPALPNPGQRKDWLCMLLWGVEVRDLLKAHGVKSLTKYRVWENWALVEECSTITIPLLEAYVSACLCKRMDIKLRQRARAKMARSY